MFKKGQVSTQVDKGPFIFTLVSLAAGLAVTVLLFVLGKGDGLAVFAGILFAVVTLAAAAVLFALVSDRVYIEDEVLHMSYLFRRRTVPIKDIGKISFADDLYFVFDKKDTKIGTMNAKLTSIGDVIFALDKAGVNFV